ncbi:phosphatidic acid phosphatase [Flavihumibacter solisilvae]|uniref:Phosphatidic acid phosphatase n=2 Tax=Flavihumibacter solisilvae TaxID=1349421 RepID=A0A0C1LK30_9BACT|nr:phosphatidic acid phosphatase [Flavihumibacter solisilvae]
MKKILVIVLFLAIAGELFSQASAPLNKRISYTTDAYPLHRAQKALTDVIVHDIFSPPVASRIYVYANMAAFECLAAGDHNLGSLHGQLSKFPAIPAPGKEVVSSVAAIHAFFNTAKQLVFSEKRLMDSAAAVLKWYKTKSVGPKQLAASEAYGKLVSDSILKWVAADNYKETRRMKRYNLLKQPGTWLPTPPGYMAAIEPHWNKIRPIALDSAAQCKPAPPTRFATDSSSAFYKEAIEVWQTGKQLSTEQIAIASFWDCNPFFLNTQGHLNFATKKISPGGHWMLITALVCRQKLADIKTSAAAYTIVSAAIFDGFISCWDEKYRSHLVRPETFINSNIDESWRPLLQTPPFPEYPSGHSVISTAAAGVLTSIFGDNFAFDDSTELEYGLPVRHFRSFKEACDEAAISRLYGGIHYRPAIENGQTQGRQVGEIVLQKLKLNR